MKSKQSKCIPENSETRLNSQWIMRTNQRKWEAASGSCLPQFLMVGPLELLTYFLSLSLLIYVLCLVTWLCPTLLRPLLCPWGFSRQEYWSGLPFPSSGNLPDPWIARKSFVLKADFYQLSYKEALLMYKVEIMIISLPKVV